MIPWRIVVAEGLEMQTDPNGFHDIFLRELPEESGRMSKIEREEFTEGVECFRKIVIRTIIPIVVDMFQLLARGPANEICKIETFFKFGFQK